jgi:hypothetical protein
MVNSQWLYFSPQKKIRQGLQDFLGEDLGKDLNTHYLHTLFVIGVHSKGITISLKINQKAWWDGKNLANKIKSPQELQSLLSIIRRLDKFSMKLHDWPNLHKCKDMNRHNLQQFFQYYVPGNHWLHVDYEVEKTSSLLSKTDFFGHICDCLVSLIPFYQFALWTSTNNYLFDKEKGTLL